jgi:hypothetical protein
VNGRVGALPASENGSCDIVEHTSLDESAKSYRETEYAAMRATIRERGTARLVLLPVVFISWAATVVATTAAINFAMSTLVPLLILAAGFEAIYALYTNVERIGRYLQVFHEPSAGWEHVTMEFGRRFTNANGDPLFSRLFTLATSVNFLPAALGGTPAELIILAVLHLVLIGRIRAAKSAAGAQRQRDLERFSALRGAGSTEPPHDS